MGHDQTDVIQLLYVDIQIYSVSVFAIFSLLLVFNRNHSQSTSLPS